jgi:hypothetical protein
MAIGSADQCACAVEMFLSTTAYCADRKNVRLQSDVSGDGRITVIVGAAVEDGCSSAQYWGFCYMTYQLR